MGEEEVKRAVYATIYVLSVIGSICSFLLLMKQFWDWLEAEAIKAKKR